MARLFGSFCVAFYKPLYFAKVYPNFVDEFSIGNAFIYCVIATASALIGGQLSDKYEKKSYRIKSYLCMKLVILMIFLENYYDFHLMNNLIVF